ncbi:patatin-like phospholipase family protein [Temperatibacter marinus]|uniref:Patatin-like phospholipase family protein n=1 Tax=Temperatibacter marinus TaxID=1456591 RepID=A0AA52EJ62_9PROT|nr:patatin-like phospholipase family protein [Temperatibacter marinus]WND03254.1 patatin-like phospholipase family protein [Temperatibacter marinus]
MSDSFENVLTLSGGNVKGAYQAGAIKYLLQEEKYEPDAIYGVSVGALNGGILTSLARTVHKDGKPDWPTIADGLLKVWTEEVTQFSDLGYARSTVSLIWTVLVQQLFSSSYRKFTGLVNMDKAEELMYKSVDGDDLKNSPVYYACGVIDMLSGDYKRVSNRDEISADLLMRYMVASTREPIVMDVLPIEEGVYGDGGARDILPFVGDPVTAKKVAAIALNANHLNPERQQEDMYRLLSIFDRTKSIMINEVSDEDCQKLVNINKLITQTPPIEYKLIRPAAPDEIEIDRETFTSKDIHELIERGFERAKREKWKT